jgi:hypothetical protein
VTKFSTTWDHRWQKLILACRVSFPCYIVLPFFKQKGQDFQHPLGGGGEGRRKNFNPLLHKKAQLLINLTQGDISDKLRNTN